MEELLKQILKSDYNIEVSNVKRYKKLWQVTSINKSYIIKPFKALRAIDSVYALNICMQKKGFKNFPLLLLTKGNQPYFNINDQYYVVMPYIEGRLANFKRIEDLQKVVNVLALFHHSGAFFSEQLNLNYYSPIHYRLENRLFAFKGLFNSLLIKKDKTLLDKKIIELGKDILTYSAEALNLINREIINNCYQEAYDNKFIAHRDVASHNFIVNSQGWLIDFDITGIEPQFLDLWQLLNRVMLEVDWSIDRFQMIEEMYFQNKRLRDYERSLIRKLSLFPNDIIRESIGAYLYPHKFNQSYTIRILDNFIYNFDAYQTFRKKIGKV